MKLKFFACASLALLLAACAAQKPRELPQVSTEQAENLQVQRQHALYDQNIWSFTGRIAISNGKNAGSGRIEWVNSDEFLSIEMSAPVTRQSWRLDVDESEVRIEGLEGGTRRGTDIEQLLREATGWSIPVTALGDWVRGFRAPEPAPTVVRYDASGRLSHLEQGGWAIDYRWPETASPGPEMPKRVDAVKGEAKVKLVVDEWRIEPLAASETPTSQTDRLKRALSALNLRDPAVDLQTAIAADDFRPIGVCGFACLAPGFDGDRRIELRIIDGTGDVVEGDEHLRLIEQATAYARAYNQALSAWLRENPQGMQVPEN